MSSSQSDSPEYVAYQDETGDLYCPEHVRDRDIIRPRIAEQVEAITARLREVFGPDARGAHCDFCGCDLPPTRGTDA